jgi:predicted lysophospholipase L1 biosynthesis ABC-type transport system permease subunit
MSLLAGRDFNDSDLRTRQVAVVSRSLAQQLWPGGGVGGDLRLGDTTYRVVGIVADLSDRGGRGAAPSMTPHVFVPSDSGSDFVVRVSGDPRQSLTSILDHARLHEKYLRVSGYSYDGRRRLFAEDERAYAVFMGAIALAALLIGGLGAVIVVTDACRRSLRVIAIRVGIGASPAQAVAVAVGRSCGWLIVGTGCGILCGLVISHSLQLWIQHVKSIEPVALALCIVIALIGLLVSYARALRLATQADLTSMLRRTE